MRIRGGCCGLGVRPKFSAALGPERGRRRGGGRGDRTLRELDAGEPAPSAGAGGSGPAPCVLPTPASPPETNVRGQCGGIAGGHGRRGEGGPVVFAGRSAGGPGQTPAPLCVLFPGAPAPQRGVLGGCRTEFCATGRRGGGPCALPN